MNQLIIEDEEGRTTVVPLTAEELSIGREEGNTIRLTERNVSRRHAKLHATQNSTFVEDLGSYTGTKVNGEKIAGRVAVKTGDQIQIGDYMLWLQPQGTEIRRRTEGPPTREMPRLQMARLVVVSPHFGGNEFALERKTMVVGRTADNDIVLDHRSISRHHCRIVEEQGRYTIVDLKSANGVRINGEEYEQAELRRGDFVDLGEITLRYVAPGEDFIFTSDAVYEVEEGWSAGAWVVISALALVGLGLLAYIVLKPAAPVDDTDNGYVVRSSSASDGVIAAVESAVRTESWQAALEQCAKLSPDQRVQVAPECLRAKREISFKTVFEQGVAKVTQLDYAAALEQFNKIPTESFYYERIAKSAAYKEARKKYLAATLEKLDQALKRKDCDAVRAMAADALKLIPDATKIKLKETKCIPSTPRGGRGSTAPAASPAAPAAADAPSRAETERWLAQAQTAFKGGSHRQAMMLADKVLREIPTDPVALKIKGASACYLKEPNIARSAYIRLDATRRREVKQVCQQLGISLD
jgi:pSer/pThr/pTyr-binding forkhead associated (FHA) protein